MILPNLIFAGAPKAGSSSICKMLSQHPDIFIPEPNKELFYFDFNYDKGLEWYSSHFSAASNSKIRVDATVWYLRRAEVAPRIRVSVPNAKILFVLRDPVKRAWSNYLHDYTELSYSLSLSPEELIFDHDPKGILKGGLYFECLSRWRDELREFDFKIMLFEDFVNSPIKFCESILEFCELNNTMNFKCDRRMNARSFRRGVVPTLAALQTAMPKSFKSLTKHALNRTLVRRVLYSNTRPALRCPNALKLRLIDFYREDFDLFCSHIEPRARDLWKSFSSDGKGLL